MKSVSKRSAVIFHLWELVVAFHLFVVFGNLFAIFVLPFMTPWYISLPLMTWVFNLTFTQMVDCPVTKLENKLRRELGMKEIKFFVGHYITWPIKRKFRARRKEETK
jgi:hypothetical protein